MFLYLVLLAETFWTNPQYNFEVVDPDEGDDEDAGTVILALMQKERRKKRKEGLDLLTIGYAVYKASDSYSFGQATTLSYHCFVTYLDSSSEIHGSRIDEYFGLSTYTTTAVV